MRHRSLTNSRKHENLELRQRYREANPACELSKLLRKSRLILTDDDSVEVHHLFGNFGQRYDLLSNLLTVSRTVHRYLHDHPTDGRLICLNHKRLKGELDLDEFHRASGRHLAGWLDASKPLHTLAVSARAELAAWCETKGT